MSVYLPQPATSDTEEDEGNNNPGDEGDPENNICLYGRVVPFLAPSVSVFTVVLLAVAPPDVDKVLVYNEHG